MEIASKNPFGDGDLEEISGEYRNSALLLVVGTLSEALEAVRNLRDWFDRFEARWERETDGDGVPFLNRVSLPIEDRRELLRYADQASEEWGLIKTLRDTVAFHWRHSLLFTELSSIPEGDLLISKVVDSDRGTIVYYEIADRLISKIAFTDDHVEMERRVIRIREVVVCFLKVTSAYLPSYLALVGCSRHYQ